MEELKARLAQLAAVKAEIDAEFATANDLRAKMDAEIKKIEADIRGIEQQDYWTNISQAKLSAILSLASWSCEGLPQYIHLVPDSVLTYEYLIKKELRYYHGEQNNLNAIMIRLLAERSKSCTQYVKRLLNRFNAEQIFILGQCIVGTYMRGDKSIDDIIAILLELLPANQICKIICAPGMNNGRSISVNLDTFGKLHAKMQEQGNTCDIKFAISYMSLR